MRRVVGHEHVLVGRDQCGSFESDITRRWQGEADAVVLPSCVAEVAAVLQICSTARIPVVPQGGNTGLSGGAIPTDGEVVLSLRRLNRLEQVDILRREVVAQAGVTLAELQNHVRREGLEFPVDIAARSAATIGGMAATNAGGAYAYRYGTMSNQVVGMEAVLADGSVIDHLGGLRKDTAGYRLPQLLLGSEGTLAILTRLRLRLVRPRRERIAILIGLDDMGRAMGVFERLQEGAEPYLDAIDFFDHAGMELVCRRRSLSSPIPSSPVYVIAECGGDDDPTSDVAAALDHLPSTHVAVSTDEPGRTALWSFRESLNETVNSGSVPMKLDVGVPITELPAFVDRAREVVATQAPEASLYLWGHLGDGNVHVNIVGWDTGPADLESCVLRAAVECGGTISAEHGIGRAKVAWLDMVRSDAQISAMRGIKSAMDPLGLLSPGRVLAD